MYATEIRTADGGYKTVNYDTDKEFDTIPDDIKIGDMVFLSEQITQLVRHPYGHVYEIVEGGVRVAYDGLPGFGTPLPYHLIEKVHTI